MKQTFSGKRQMLLGLALAIVGAGVLVFRSFRGQAPIARDPSSSGRPRDSQERAIAQGPSLAGRSTGSSSDLQRPRDGGTSPPEELKSLTLDEAEVAGLFKPQVIERADRLIVTEWMSADLPREFEAPGDRFASSPGEPHYGRLSLSEWMNVLDGHRGPSAVDAAVIAASKIGVEAVPFLRRGLGARSARVRANTCRCLGVLGPNGESAVVDLAITLGDEDGVVRRAAAEALGNIGRRAGSALPDLEILLADPVDLVRSAAAEAIDRIAR
ncbi:MAG: HEAT repeat domain-containing protein [Candidatus Limnocylindrus sp.]